MLEEPDMIETLLLQRSDKNSCERSFKMAFLPFQSLKLPGNLIFLLID